MILSITSHIILYYIINTYLRHLLLQRRCIEYYKSEGGIDFTANFNNNTTYLERLRVSKLVFKIAQAQNT